jgi:predicted nucleic acid-binding protein
MEISLPFLSCEPVLTEVCYLLEQDFAALEVVDAMVQEEKLQMPFRLDDHSSNVFRLMREYANVPMSLADACLVRMSELYNKHLVFTLDSDFRIYRKNRRQSIPTIMPETD